MRRRTVHGVFGVTAACLAVFIVSDVVRLERARRVNSAIERASVLASDNTIPEARFARAVALGRAGDYEGALLAYKEIIQGKRPDLRRAALYNIGNLHLRAAMAGNQAAAEQVLPLVELAKQSYRDLLRENPWDWDARYNLERALYRAPESEDEVADEDTPPPRERSVATLRAQMDLP